MNINASIEKALDLSGVAVRKAGMQLEKDLARDLPDVYADAHMMEEVFLNLINNAMQALANVNSPKLIRIVSAVDRDSVIVTVSDSGPGVPPPLRQSIFDPFFTTKGDGSGIGLSLARRMVMDHGGSLSVSTSHWGGAAFTVAIPLKPEPVIERS
jgi:C4-dicarboxylate-specific signal transduction histidine kinase